MTHAVAVPRAFILDCDGVLTDPVVKCVTTLDVFAALGQRLDAGEAVTINTSRSIAWLIRNGIIDFVERSVHDKAALERFMAVCEQGASWITFIGGVIRTNIDREISVPDDVREDVYDLVTERFADCMFWDPTKLTMVSIEKVDRMPLQWFTPRQQELVTELNDLIASHHSGLSLTVEASLVATDVHDRRAGKQLGAQRIVEWLQRRGLTPQRLVAVGDTPADAAMAEALHGALDVDFVHVGEPSALDASSLHCNVVQTTARFELGTLEYLTSLS